MGLNQQLDSLLKRGQGVNAKADDERLLQLYRNRVELKKEFSRLQEENHSLQQQLRKQDSDQQQQLARLRQLEEFLGAPEHGATALIYYQLRALWSCATRNLADLRRELTEQQRERERKLRRIEFDQNRQRHLDELDQAAFDKRSQIEAVDARVRLLQRQLAGLRWFWNRRKRYELQLRLKPLTEELAQAGAELQMLEDRRSELAGAVLPEISSLTVEGKRLINTATLAYAQQLLARFGENGLAALAKDASIKQITDVRYGSEQDCQLLLHRLRAALRDLYDRPRELEALKLHTQRLRANAFYRSDHETVPVPESIGAYPVRTRDASEGEAACMSEEINVLLDDYWELYAALLH